MLVVSLIWGWGGELKDNSVAFFQITLCNNMMQVLNVALRGGKGSFKEKNKEVEKRLSTLP